MGITTARFYHTIVFTSSMYGCKVHVHLYTSSHLLKKRMKQDIKTFSLRKLVVYMI